MKMKTVEPAENATIVDDTETIIEEIDPEKQEMQNQIDILIQKAIKADDQYRDERRSHERDRKIFDAARLELHQTIEALHTDLAKANERERKATQRRHGSIPRLVLISLVSLVTLAIPYFLQNLSVIGPQLSFTIQCGLFMAIAWCMALIWERSK